MSSLVQSPYVRKNIAVPSKVVIVEEAAEILEPSILSSICAETEHLIMIGYHKQLRPNVDTFQLRKKSNFDVSMMERLISNGFPFRTLNQQNRQYLSIC